MCPLDEALQPENNSVGRLTQRPLGGRDAPAGLDGVQCQRRHDEGRGWGHRGRGPQGLWRLSLFHEELLQEVHCMQGEGHMGGCWAADGACTRAGILQRCMHHAKMKRTGRVLRFSKHSAALSSPCSQQHRQPRTDAVHVRSTRGIAQRRPHRPRWLAVHEVAVVPAHVPLRVIGPHLCTQRRRGGRWGSAKGGWAPGIIRFSRRHGG